MKASGSPFLFHKVPKVKFKAEIKNSMHVFWTDLHVDPNPNKIKEQKKKHVVPCLEKILSSFSNASKQSTRSSQVHVSNHYLS